VGMSHRQRHYPNQLSGGQQQRVAVARALAGSPSILLADEPTGNLDSKNGDAVMELLSELHQGGATICMVTHDSRFAQYAQRTVHLFDGQIVAEDQDHTGGICGPSAVASATAALSGDDGSSRSTPDSVGTGSQLRRSQ